MKRTTEELSEDESLPGPSTAPVQKKARTRRTKKTEISTEGWPQYFISVRLESVIYDILPLTRRCSLVALSGMFTS